MYAVIETGGKQYRVQPGDVIDVELLHSVTEEDPEVVFDRVLLVGADGDVKVGNPTVEGAQVHGQRVREIRGPKVTVFKMKRRKGYRRKNGHRQDLLQVEIKDIQA
ncbi:MAG: 50S ribosomal protein L21 [Acidobacteriota bacterium]